MQNKRDPNQLTFGQAVKRHRERAGLTQQQLSDQLARFRIKLDTSAITRIENGAREPRLREAQLIAQLLHVSLDDLIPALEVSPELVAAKLWGDVQDAHWGLVDTVYEFGEARRALSQCLDQCEEQGIVLEKQDQMRADSRLRAIADWPTILAEVRRRTISEKPQRDESIWDAEA